MSVRSDPLQPKAGRLAVYIADSVASESDKILGFGRPESHSQHAAQSLVHSKLAWMQKTASGIVCAEDYSVDQVLLLYVCADWRQEVIEIE